VVQLETLEVLVEETPLTPLNQIMALRGKVTEEAVVLTQETAR
jgi:hypothetical protein